MDMKKKSSFYKPMKEDRGNFKETPPATKDGHLIGASAQKKGVNHAQAIRHDGIIIGGSVTKERPSAPESSINKLPSGGRRNIVGSD